MIRTFIAAIALVSFVAPALASEVPERSAFTRDGIEYVYTTEPIGHGRRILKGTANGAPFRLVAGDKMVRGTVDGCIVEFSLSEVRARAKRERFATR